MANIAEAFASAEARLILAGRLQDAEHVCRQILQVAPNHPETLHLAGIINVQLGNLEAAVECFEAALKVYPKWADALCNLGVALKSLGKLDEAIAIYRRALILKPDFAAADNNLGDILKSQGKLEEAAACHRRALALHPDYFDALYNLGNVLHAQGKLDEAEATLQRALQLKPDYAEAHNNLGAVYNTQGKLNEAVACYRRALQLKPAYAEAYNNLGAVFKSQSKLNDATACFRRAVQLNPEFAAAHANLGGVYYLQGKLDAAVDSYRWALHLKPDVVGDRCQLVHQLQQMCQWGELTDLSKRVIEAVNNDAEDAAPVSPFAFFALPIVTTAKQQLRCAERWAKKEIAAHIQEGDVPEERPAKRTSKITIGYLSADFRDHATAFLIAEMIEKHDRGRFEIIGYSYGVDDRSAMRQRLGKAFDRFVDIRDLSFAEGARRIAGDGVDILVDLKGYTADARTAILAYRPAPIQVNFLGYPGTMGASFMDYILVDDFIVPSEQQPDFTEKLVHLPGCYQVNDSCREIASETPSRAECGLPENGFVFCSFNNNYKITAEVFDVWMRLLQDVPDSVLWLFEGNRFAPENLRREAGARGIAHERLVFAPRRPPAQHLARHRLADLFLDTFPVNAHTTASDALWAGCPLLTLAGETFASRVAGSLLRAIGLPELIATSLVDYEATALRLASDAHVLGDIRTRLAVNRMSSPLFDAGQFARKIERAYATMWDIHAAGEKPRAFAVAP